MRDVFRQSGRLWEMRFLWIYLYLFKLVIAAIFVFPFFVTANVSLSGSEFTKTLLKCWDISVIVEFIAHRGNTVLPLMAIFLTGGLLYVIFMQFINGGLYYAVTSGQYSKITRRVFFEECGANFGTHLRITVMMLLVYIILIPAGMFFVGIIGTLGDHLSGTPMLVFNIVKMLILLAILAVASTFSDSLRTTAAAFPDKSFREILGQAANYFRPRLLKLFMMFVVTYIPFVIIWIASEYTAFEIAALLTGIIGLFLEFVLFQITSVARTGQKLWYLLTLGHSYRGVSPGRFIAKQAELKLE